jgi:hydrogenase nickel incorporation protein HypA/HybF
MSLMESVISICEDEAKRQGFARVKTIVLDIGALGHVAPEALSFCFEAVSRGSIADGARLDIQTQPGEGWCMDCSRTVPLAERFGACPECGGHKVQLIKGDEMKIRELEVE